MKPIGYLQGFGMLFGVLLILISIVGIGQAGIPLTLNFQGYLTNPAGNPVQGSLPMVFSMYVHETGGSALWTETHPDIQVMGGIYSVLLGETTPLNLPFDTPYYLGIQVGSDPEMTPRLPLSSVGYAFRAGSADQALIQGFPVSPAVPSSNQVLKFNGTNWGPSVVDLERDASGVLPLALGGTGSVTQNFVDLSTNQSIAGIKTFVNPISSSLSTGTAPLQINSQTLVSNLNAEMVGGKKLADLDNRYVAAISPNLAPRVNILNSLQNFWGSASISIGLDGFPIISGTTNSGVGVAKCGDFACSPSLMTLRTLDATVASGQYTSITIGTDGFPVISYYDYVNKDLKVAKCGDISCNPDNAVVNTLDTDGEVGLFTSITIATDGFPVISYWDSTNADLKVAKCGDALCSAANVNISIPDSTDYVGGHTSIIIGTDGFPVISYKDYTNNSLKVAKCGDVNCDKSFVVLNTIDSGGDLGRYTSIAIGSDGFPVISYHDWSNGDLKVAKCRDASCSPGMVIINTLDSGGNVGLDTSIVIGLDGFPVIAYLDWSNMDLKVAKCGNASCDPSLIAINTLDSNGDVGYGARITIGTDGLPIISYGDATTGHLKVVKCANAYCLNNWWRR